MERGGNIDGSGRLAHAALLVDYGDDLSHEIGLLGVIVDICLV